MKFEEQATSITQRVSLCIFSPKRRLLSFTVEASGGGGGGGGANISRL